MLIEFKVLASAFGPIAIASLPFAPSLFLFPASSEFTEKYFILFASFDVCISLSHLVKLI